MRVEASETRLEVRSGYPATTTVSVFNTADVITGYVFRVLGADPSWVTIDFDQLNLFPGDDGSVTVTLALPIDFPAGWRRLGVVVENVTDPTDYRVIDLDVHVLEVKEARVELAPSIITGGTVGLFNLVVNNTGNAVTTFSPTGEEKEGEASIEFTPEVIEVAPGDQETVAVRVRHKRPLLGAPATRIFTFGLADVEPPPQTVGSFNQRPWIGRGIISMTGLLISLVVFFVVITTTFDRVLDESTVDQKLVDQAAASQDAVSRVGGSAVAQGAGGSGAVDGLRGTAFAPNSSAAISGRVTTDVIERSGGSPVVSGFRSVTVQLYAADDDIRPVATTTTGEGGLFEFATAPPGEYKLRAVSAGFLETWFPAASDSTDAESFIIDLGEPAVNRNITIRVKRGTINGVVLAADPSDVTISLNDGAGTATIATVREVETDAGGSFLIEDIPIIQRNGQSVPYELVAEKEGFAVERRLITVTEGEIISGVRIRLRDGDGRLAGSVTLGDRIPDQDELIQVMAAADGNEFFTVTHAGGQFTFRDLPSPALYSITATRDGFSEETVTATLESAEQATLPQPINLEAQARVISGTVRGPTGDPLAGAELVASDGQRSFTTRADRNGDFVVDDLVDGISYTVTASKDGFLPTTTRLRCDQASDCTGQVIRLRSETSSVSGIVCLRRSDGSGTDPVGGVSVTIERSGFTASTVSADVFFDPPPGLAATLGGSECLVDSLRGYYRIDGVPTGVYTVTFSQEGRVDFTQVITTPTVQPVHQTIVNTSNVIITVADQADAKVAGARVELWEESDFRQKSGAGTPTIGTITTDETGVALFAQVRPGNYVVVVRYRPDESSDPQEISRSFAVLLGQTVTDKIVIRR